MFRNPRFSAASFSVAVAFFGLFGFIFLITQYFQFVRGYSTLSAGLHTLPFAVAAAVAAPIAARLALRFGTKRVVTAGLASMSIGFFWASTLGADTPYWTVVVPQMVLIAAGLTLTTAPATEAILGSLPKEKAGVGSAVNDTTRELGGTLGVAVVGSVFSSLYGPELVGATLRPAHPRRGARGGPQLGAGRGGRGRAGTGRGPSDHPRRHHATRSWRACTAACGSPRWPRRSGRSPRACSCPPGVVSPDHPDVRRPGARRTA